MQASKHDFEIQLCRKPGEAWQASMTVEVLEINGVRCWLSILRDTTERKPAEQALRENEWRPSSRWDKAMQVLLVDRVPRD